MYLKRLHLVHPLKEQHYNSIQSDNPEIDINLLMF